MGVGGLRKEWVLSRQFLPSCLEPDKEEETQAGILWVDDKDLFLLYRQLVAIEQHSESIIFLNKVIGSYQLLS